MVVQVTTSSDGILLNTIQTSSTPPHFAYMSTKLLLTKTSDSKPLWSICWHSCPVGKAASPSQVPHPSHIL
jgi:hypothetical protein